MANQILLVEDNLILQMLGLQQFRVLGVGLDVAPCGMTAIEKVKTNDYQLVLMDLGLPNIDGIETAILIRKHERQSGRRHLNIVAVTALFERDNVFAAGMDGFVQKPLLLDELIAILGKWAPDVKITRKIALREPCAETAKMRRSMHVDVQ